MRAFVDASAKIGFGDPYELNRRELVPFRHDRRCIGDFEFLTLACFKELLGAEGQMEGRRCGLYFAGAKDTMRLDAELHEYLADKPDRVAALTQFSEELNPLVALEWLTNIGLYLAVKEGIDCWRHTQYINHSHSDHSAVAAAVRDLSIGAVDVGFAVVAIAGPRFDEVPEKVGAVGVRIVAQGDNEAGDVFEVVSRPQPELLLEMQSAHSVVGHGSALAIELPVNEPVGS
ncbi:MAG: hypothetical protein OXE93_01665 [bacterium]|nr:hypothetical protein [bacterium]MCY4256844.1 hypothetical protein [bacterium]